jgi:hypothetical protein
MLGGRLRHHVVGARCSHLVQLAYDARDVGRRRLLRAVRLSMTRRASVAFEQVRPTGVSGAFYSFGGERTRNLLGIR